MKLPQSMPDQIPSVWAKLFPAKYLSRFSLYKDKPDIFLYTWACIFSCVPANQLLESFLVFPHVHFQNPYNYIVSNKCSSKQKPPSKEHLFVI